VDVKWCVADHNDFFGPQIFPQHASSAFECGGGDVIAVFVVIGKPAGFKKIPKSVTAQLDFRAEADVAGEQAKHRRLRQRAQAVEEFRHAPADFAAALGDDVVEPENETLEKPLEILRCGRDVVVAEKFADETHVGAPGEPDFINAVAHFELRGEGFGESLRTGASRVNERAVNIKQNQSYHAPTL
jgi:hypothetical protein